MGAQGTGRIPHAVLVLAIQATQVSDTARGASNEADHSGVTSEAYDVEVGPIWNHDHAKQKAEEYVRLHPGVRWTGHWRTTIPGRMSVIGVVREGTPSEPPVGEAYNVEVGPIWNHDHAKQKAEEYVRLHPGVRWTGHWHTTIPCRMSVINVVREDTPSEPPVGEAYDVEVGPIWNHDHAKQKAEEYVRLHPGVRWTGHWHTTVPGSMSVINVVRGKKRTS